MGKKKNPPEETELKSLLPAEVMEAAQRLAGFEEKKRHLKAKAKADAKATKAQIEEIEEEIERLSRMVITQQKEVPVRSQMSFAEIEERRRHEESISAFNREAHAFSLSRQEDLDGATPTAREQARATGEAAPGKAGAEDSSPPAAVLPESEREAMSLPAAPERNTLAGGLYAALHNREGAAERWVRLRKRGATDAELKLTISREFGASGTLNGAGAKAVSFKGGAKPAFWYGSSPPARPTLAGRALVERAREALSIPQPQARLAKRGQEAEPTHNDAAREAEPTHSDAAPARLAKAGGALTHERGAARSQTEAAGGSR